MTEKLYNKIDKFCNETDWSKYPTYEHALEEFIKGVVAEETNELQKENKQAKEIITEFMSWGKGLSPTWHEVISKAEAFLKE